MAIARRFVLLTHRVLKIEMSLREFLLCCVQCTEMIDRYAPSTFELIATWLVSIVQVYIIVVTCILTVLLYTVSVAS